MSKSTTPANATSELDASCREIPGAVNLPLFDDDQRAEVGTIFKNSGKDDAVLRGLSIVGPKMADLAKTARKLAAGNKDQIFVHCWRGGMRSRSMLWLLETAGLQPKILSGGYKAFRAMAQESFVKQWPLKVVSGLTGAGKTRVLGRLGKPSWFGLRRDRARSSAYDRAF